MQGLAETIERQRLDVELEVGRGHLGAGAEESAQLAGRHGKRARAAQGVLEHHHGAPPGRGGALVERVDALHLEDHAQLQVVLQIAADAGQFVHQGHAGRLQQVGRAHARALQDRRRTDGPGGEQGLGAGAHPVAHAPVQELDAAGGAALEQHTVDQGVREDGEVGPVAHRPQERAGRIPAQALLLVHLEATDAEVVAAVVVRAGRDAGLAGRLDIAIEQVPVQALAFHAPFARAPVRRVRAAPVVLAVAEDRQDAVPVPARIAGDARPALVIGGLAAQVEHAVDGRAAAQHAAARIEDRAAVEAGLRLGAVAPVRARMVDAFEIADRDMDPDPVVRPARFEQQHAHGRIGRQPVGQHAAGRPATGDHVVVSTEVPNIVAAAHCPIQARGAARARGRGITPMA